MSETSREEREAGAEARAGKVESWKMKMRRGEEMILLAWFGFGSVWFGFGFGLVWFGLALAWFGLALALVWLGFGLALVWFGFPLA